MVPMPKLETSTVKQIYKAYEEEAAEWDAIGVAVSEAGEECDRAIWYALRWACHREKIPGRMRRRFETGAREEERLITNLKQIGVSVKGSQEKFQALGGHVRGKVDGRLINVPEAPKTEHVLECKAVNLKAMNALGRNGVKKASPKHYAQCQLAMHLLGLTRALYLVTCTDDDTLHSERITYDTFYASSLVARLSRIIRMDKPPEKLCNGCDDFRARFCKQKAACFGGELMRHSCRSCMHSYADIDGQDAAWNCRRHERALSLEEQKQGCPQHLNIPETVPGKQGDFDPATETVKYEMPGGIISVGGE